MSSNHYLETRLNLIPAWIQEIQEKKPLTSFLSLAVRADDPCGRAEIVLNFAQK